MKIKYLYLALAIIGTVLTMSQLIPFMRLNGPDIYLMFKELFRNEATSFFGYDLLVTALTALIFMYVDGKRNKVPYFWIPIASVFLVGLALGLPLYLYLRESYLEKTNR
jgi:CDP-diglyceride synthetase